MRKICKIMVMVFSIMSLISCSKDTSDDEYPPGVEPPNYDVWYDIPGALTVDHIWCDGTRWIEAYSVTGEPTVQWGVPKLIGYTFIEYHFKECLVMGKKYLRVLVTNPYDKTLIEPTDGYLRRDGRKIYGLNIETGEEILYYDFNEWVGVETIHLNYFYIKEIDVLEIKYPIFYRLTYDMTLPYMLFGNSNNPDYIRHIGLIEHGLSCYQSSTRCAFVSGSKRVDGKPTIIKITSGKTSEEVFRHPKLEEFLSNEVPFIPEGLDIVYAVWF